MRFHILPIAIALSFTLAACNGGGDKKEAAAREIIKPELVFPNAPAPDDFRRAYTLTESPDGNARVFTRDRPDGTDLYFMRKEGEDWSSPTLLDWPKRNSNANPHFSPFDTYMYFASDRDIPETKADEKTRRDMSLWRIPFEAGEWGEAELVPGDVNTGADDETSVSISADGVMVFVSDNPSGQGGEDLYLAEYQADTGEWLREALPEHVNSPFVESHAAITPDGQHILYYSRRSPRVGMVDIIAVSREGEGWSKPYNLGPHINARPFTYGAAISANGETFFLSQGGELMETPMQGVYETLREAQRAQKAGEEESFIRPPAVE